MERAAARGTELAYEWMGEGEPTVVVLPQWFLSRRSMRDSALVRRLARDHRVLVYDRRGTGDSDKPGPPYTLGRDSRDLAGLVEELGLEGFVLLGHGVRGSQLALHYAGHFPDTVRAVICLGGTPRWAAGPEWPYGISAEAWDDAFGWLHEHDDPPPGASLHLVEDWQSCGPEAARDILQRTRDEDLRHFLPKVTPPTLVVHLRGDEFVPFEAARWLAESLPHGTLEVFEGSREIPFRAYEELAEHIDEFLGAMR